MVSLLQKPAAFYADCLHFQTHKAKADGHSQFFSDI